MIVLQLPISINAAWKRSRAGFIYKTPEAKSWQQIAAWEIKTKMRHTIPGAVGLTVAFYFDNKRRDIDNGLKLLLDSIQESGIIENDSQISDMQISKRYSKEAPRVELDIYQTNCEL